MSFQLNLTHSSPAQKLRTCYTQPGRSSINSCKLIFRERSRELLFICCSLTWHAYMLTGVSHLVNPHFAFFCNKEHFFTDTAGKVRIIQESMFKSYREEKERERESDRIARGNLYLRCTETEPMEHNIGKQHTTIEKEFDIKERIKWAACDIITRDPSVKVTYRWHDPEFSRDIYPKGYKNAQLIRRIIQFILFYTIICGLMKEVGMDRDILILLFIVFVGLSAWIRYEAKEANLYKQRAELLNKLITTDDIAAYMRTNECYQFISDQAESPYTSSKDRNHMNEYIFWYLHRPASQPRTSVRKPQS